jgi:alpha-D-ribose 1-methylphosphonate 5-triphosphate diphosphatase PhnM
MRDAVQLTRLLHGLGWRVEVTESGPKLSRVGDSSTALPDGLRRQLAVLKPDLIRLHTPHVCDAVKPRQKGDQPTGPCGAVVSDGVLLVEANETGVGCGCPFAHCPYRG